jgi:hypothetical protein
MKKKNCNHCKLIIQGVKVESFIRKLEDINEVINHDEQYAETGKEGSLIGGEQEVLHKWYNTSKSS